MEEGVTEVSESELLPEDFRWPFEEESKREAVLAVCEDGGGETSRAEPLTEKGWCVEPKALSYGKDGVLH